MNLSVTENKEQDVLFKEEQNSVLVIIVKHETREGDDNINQLKRLFSDPYFTVQVLNINIPKNIVGKSRVENYLMYKALTYASEGPYFLNSDGDLEPKFWWETIPVIIIKDSSVSNLTSKEMKKRISSAIKKSDEVDLFFLCKWNDSCEQYINVLENNHFGSKLKWSKRPTSTQAIMYTPKSREFIRKELLNSNVPLSDILNSNIFKGTLKATVFVPNLIDFDIDLASSKEDYYKLNECSTPRNKENNHRNIIIWILVLIALVIIVAWVIIQPRL